MIETFLSGDAEQLKSDLIQNGLDEELRTYLWREVFLARCHHPTSITDWNEACVKIVLAYIYNDVDNGVLFIDRFAQACATVNAKNLIAYCFDYSMEHQTLYDLLEYAVRCDDLNALKKLQNTSIDFSLALIGCSAYNNLKMAEYLLPSTDPLYFSSYAWFCALEKKHLSVLEFLQPHSQIVEAGYHAIQNISGRAYTTLINNYIQLISNTKNFGLSQPCNVALARDCIQKKDLFKIPLQNFSHSVLEVCCFLAVVCKNPTSLALVDALPIISLKLAQYLQNKSYRLFKYAVSHQKISMKDLNFLLEHSVYETKERDVLFLLRSGVDPQLTLDKWASYNPDCIDQLLKYKETVDAKKQRKVLINNTLRSHTQKKRKI